MKEIIIFVFLVLLSFVAINLFTQQNKEYDLDGCIGNRNTLLCIGENQEDSQIEKQREIYKTMVVKSELNEKKVDEHVQAIHESQLLITMPDVLETLEIQPTEESLNIIHAEQYPQFPSDSEANSHEVPSIEHLNEVSEEGEENNREVIEEFKENEDKEIKIDLKEVEKEKEYEISEGEVPNEQPHIEPFNQNQQPHESKQVPHNEQTNHQVNQEINHQSTNEETHQEANQDINQDINQGINQDINQGINQDINQDIVNNISSGEETTNKEDLGEIREAKSEMELSSMEGTEDIESEMREVENEENEINEDNMILEKEVSETEEKNEGIEQI